MLAPKSPGIGRMSVSISRIYISYRRTDTVAYAGRLFDHLSRHFGRGFVFMDIQGGIDPGQDFTQAIDTALNTCSVALVLIGNHWAPSTGPDGNLRLDDPNDWVRVETAAVLRRNDVVVIPVLVDGARLPDPASLPEELRPLCRRHACELTDPRWSFDVGELVKNIEKIVPRPEPKILTWLLRQLSHYLNELKLLYLQNKRHRKVGIVIALALLLGIGVGLIFGQRESNTISLPSRPGLPKEPNDGIYEATAILFGSSMKSKLTQRDPIDWYVFKTPDDVDAEFLVTYRYIRGNGWVKIEVYDSNEKTLTGDSSRLGNSISLTVKGNKKAIYYVKVSPDNTDNVDVNYELDIRNKTAGAAR
jgi:TIR domain